MISKPKETKTLIRYIKVPIQVLSRARDFYVKSLTGCGTNMAYGNAMGCPTPQMPAIQRSFSVGSSNTAKFRTVNEDLPELIRMSSRRKTTTASSGGGGGAAEHLPRSRSTPAGVGVVGPASKAVFGRIDEEREADVLGEEEEDGDVVGLLRSDQVYARSKSYAVQVSTSSKVAW